jgi:hypothetical protein
LMILPRTCKPEGSLISRKSAKKKLEMSSGELTRKQVGCLSESVGKCVAHLSKEGVVSCKYGTQDVCTANEVRKYHSMCKTVESVHAAFETQRFFVLLSIKIFH